MATKLNAVTLADPVACSVRYERVGTLVQMGGGAFRVRRTTTNAYYRIWTVTWQGVTAAQLAQITQAALLAMKGKVAFQAPDAAGTVNVLTYGAPEETPTGYDGAAWHYDVSLQLVEADPV